MRFGRSRRRVLLVGEGGLADICNRKLESGPNRVSRCAASAVPEHVKGRLDMLVLAGEPEPMPLLSTVEEQLQTRRRRSQPLRVLLIEDGPFAAEAAFPNGLSAVSPGLQLEPVSIPRRSARQLLARWPLHWGADPIFGQAIHLVIAGETAFADALMVHALRIGAYGEERLRLTRLSGAPSRAGRCFDKAYPYARQIADILYQPADNADFSQGPTVTAVVVSAESAQAGVAQAKMLRDQLAAAERCSPPIFVEIGDAQPAGDLGDWDGQLIPIDRFELALNATGVVGGRGDQLARVIHNHYRDTTEAQGRDPSSEPAGKPWEALADSYRDANRHQADHLWAKLAVTDCKAVPEQRVQSFAFAPIEVERLAMIEHARWAAERWLDGWSYAPVRDNARKHHPQLLAYRELSAPMKDLDRFAVRLVPTLLARSGLGILRILLVGVRATSALSGAQLDRSIRRTLERLSARYPDRALIIATSLGISAQRRLVRSAIDDFDAGFFWLLDRPAPELLAGLSPDARMQSLALITHAERRIRLASTDELDRWLDARAEILVEIGAGNDDATATAETNGRKRLRIDPEIGLDWNFEY